VFDGAHAGQEHKIIRLDRAADQEKEKLLNAKQGAVRPRLDLLLESLTRTHHSIVNDVRASEAIARDRINSHFDGLLRAVGEAVEKRKAELIRRLGYHEQLRIRKLSAQRSMLSVAVSEAQDALEDMDKGLAADPVTCLKSKAPRGERLALVVSQKCQTDPVVGSGIELALDDTLEAQLVKLVSRQGDISGPARPKLLDTVANAQYCGVDISWACKASPGEVIKEYAVEIARVVPSPEEKDFINAMARNTPTELALWQEEKYIEVWRGKDRHYSILEVAQNSNYRVRVRAQNAVGWGAYSEPREFQTDAKPIASAGARAQLLQQQQQQNNLALSSSAAGPPLPTKQPGAQLSSAAPARPVIAASAPAASSAPPPGGSSPVAAADGKQGAVAASASGGRVRVFSYTSDFDQNGIIYYIGTRGGSQEFVNPADQGLIVVSRSSSEQGRPKDALSREPVAETYTRREPDSWYMFDLKNRRCIPSHYTIRHDLERGYYVRSWKIEASNDQQEWTLLKDHKNDAAINAPGASATFAVNAAGEFRFFRLTQTGQNASGDLYFVISGFELYGQMRQLRPQK
jgi:hypothetical protein